MTGLISLMLWKELRLIVYIHTSTLFIVSVSLPRPGPNTIECERGRHATEFFTASAPWLKLNKRNKRHDMNKKQNKLQTIFKNWISV